MTGEGGHEGEAGVGFSLRASALKTLEVEWIRSRIPTDHFGILR